MSKIVKKTKHKKKGIKIFSSALVVLDSKSLVFFDHKTFFELKFPKNTVNDLEIVGLENLNEALHKFIKENKITSNNIIMVLNSNLFFEKILKDSGDIYKEISNFIELTPFEEVCSKTIQLDGETRILSTNKKLVTTIKDILEKEGLDIQLVIPYLALDKHSLNTENILEVNGKKDLDQLLKQLLPYNLLTENTVLNGKPAEKPKKEPKRQLFLQERENNPKSKRPLVLLSIFIALIFVLIGLVLFMNRKPPEEFTAPEIPQSMPLIAPIGSDQQEQTSGKTVENTTIKVVYDNNLDSAVLLTKGLSSLGFNSVILEKAGSESNTSKTYIDFSTNYPQSLRDKLIGETNKIFVDTVVQDSEVSDYDVVITL